MKYRLYLRTLSPLIIMPLALISVPIMFVYMWIRHPRKSLEVWRQARRDY